MNVIDNLKTLLKQLNFKYNLNEWGSGIPDYTYKITKARSIRLLFSVPMECFGHIDLPTDIDRTEKGSKIILYYENSNTNQILKTIKIDMEDIPTLLSTIEQLKQEAYNI